VIVAGGGLAVAIGVGRSGFGDFEMGLWSRYGLLTAPLIVMAYLTFVDRPRVQQLLAVAVLVFLPFNTAVGWGWGRHLDAALTPLEAAARRGDPPSAIVAQYLDGSGQEARALVGLPLLVSPTR
jgi:hypothetical protein